MKGGERTEKILIISGDEKSSRILIEMMSQIDDAAITAVSNAGAARRMMINDVFDLCIVNAPLPDETGETLALDIAEESETEVILLLRSEVFEEVTANVEDDGVITVAKPMNKALLWNAVKVARAAHKRLQKMQSKNAALQQKIEDIRIIDRAKCVLIAYLNMSEDEAHKYIERHAMDLRTSRRRVAEDILRTYEN